MALIKEIDTDRGPATYWVVSLVQLDNFNRRGFVSIYGFFSKAYADRPNPQPVRTIELTIEGEVYEEYFHPVTLEKSGNNPHRQAYEMLKRSTVDDAGNLIDFTDAKDEIGG